jgi:hydrogenase maturation factor
MGRIFVGGALKKVALDLLTGARCGDTVLLCDGVAISRAGEMTKPETMTKDETRTRCRLVRCS